MLICFYIVILCTFIFFDKIFFLTQDLFMNKYWVIEWIDKIPPPNPRTIFSSTSFLSKNRFSKSLSFVFVFSQAIFACVGIMYTTLCHWLVSVWAFYTEQLGPFFSTLLLNKRVSSFTTTKIKNKIEIDYIYFPTISVTLVRYHKF